MEFKVWSGVNSIGTNIVEIRSEKARLITDLGIPYSGQDDFLLNLGENLVEGRIRLGHIPDLRGIYRADLGTVPTAILISHLHLDHMGALPYLDPSIPVYLHEDSLKLYKALARAQKGYRQKHDFRAVKPGESFTFHDFQITFLESDHDIVGASAILVEHEGKSLVHSGDLRLHGRKSEQVRTLCKTLNEKNLDHLFIEGSSFTWSDHPLFPTEITREAEERKRAKGGMNDKFDKYIFCQSEQEFDENLAQSLSENSQALIAINPYLANVERLHAIQNIARDKGRELVLDTAGASVLQAFYPDSRITLLNIESEEDEFLHGHSSAMQPADELKPEDYGTPLKKCENIEPVSLEEILANPEHFLVQNTVKQLEILGKLKPSLYIHSNGTPLGDFAPGYAELREFLEEISCEYQLIACGGHASTEDLVEIIKAINAKVVHPWHSGRVKYMAEVLNKLGFPIEVTEIGKIYQANYP